MSFAAHCILRGYLCPTWTRCQHGMSYVDCPTWTEVSFFDPRGHLHIDLRGQAPTWGIVLRGRWPTWSLLHWPTRSSPYVGKSPTWTLTYVVTSPLTYEVKPLRGEKSDVDVDLRGHCSIDLRGRAPTWGTVLRGRWPTRSWIGKSHVDKQDACHSSSPAGRGRASTFVFCHPAFPVVSWYGNIICIYKYE